MVDRLGVHRAQHAQLVDDAGRVRQQGAHLGAARAVATELAERRGNRQHGLVAAHAGEALARTHAVGQRLAVVCTHAWLGVEGLELRGPAGLEQVDDALRLRREVQAAVRHGILQRTGVHDVGECECAEAEPGTVQPLPAVE